jgi:hypothetical protein
MLSIYSIPQISWGLILINECYKENGPGTTIMMVLFSNPNSQKWFYSGTLLTGNLKKDMALYLQMLKQPEWSNNHILKFGTQELFINSYYIHVLALKGKITEHYLYILVRRIKCLLPALII